VRLLVEAIADAKGEIEADLGEAAEAGCYLGGPPNCGGLESIFGCLLDGYYTVHYVPPLPISRNVMTLKDLLLTTRGAWA